MSSFLYKETNFTKLGKMLRGKRWNSYSQMLKSIVHSLRLEPDEEHMHIIKSRTKDNVILSKIPIEKLMAYIELTIAKNIKKYVLNINFDLDKFFLIVNQPLAF